MKTEKMMKMLKFPVAPVVPMPAAATILKTAFDPGTGRCCIWALCPDPPAGKKSKIEKRYFLMAKTGEALVDQVADCHYLESVISMHEDPAAAGGLKTCVTHVWEVPSYLAKQKPGE